MKKYVSLLTIFTCITVCFCTQCNAEGKIDMQSEIKRIRIKKTCSIAKKLMDVNASVMDVNASILGATCRKGFF